MNITAKIKELIPPNNRDHREGFSNTKLVDDLTEDERTLVEQELIKMLYESPSDILIVRTLSYMQSQSALPALNFALKTNKIPLQRILIAVDIYKLNKDNHMADVALENFDMISSKWDLIFAFHPLAEFQDTRINDKISGFTSNSDYLISYNAKNALEQI